MSERNAAREHSSPHRRLRRRARCALLRTAVKPRSQKLKVRPKNAECGSRINKAVKRLVAIAIFHPDELLPRVLHLDHEVFGEELLEVLLRQTRSGGGSEVHVARSRRFDPEAAFIDPARVCFDVKGTEPDRPFTE